MCQKYASLSRKAGRAGTEDLLEFRPMKKTKQYLQYERDCRELAAKLADPEQKRSLQEMAATWVHIAASRKAGMMREGMRQGHPKPRQR
jgi:hypothetical protein